MTDEPENEKDGSFQTVRARQRLHELLDQNDYEITHSRDNGRPEKFPTLEVLESWIVAQTQGTSYLRKYEKEVQSIEKNYGNGQSPRNRSHKGAYEILKAEAILRDKAFKTLLYESGIQRIDRRPGGSQETIARYNMNPYDHVIPYFLEKLSAGGNIVAIVDGKPNSRKSTSMIWLVSELGGMTYMLDGEEVKIPEYDLSVNVHFTAETLMDKIEEEPPRSTIFIPDDWGNSQGANSKRNQSVESVITSELVQTARDNQFSLLMTSTRFKNIDKQARTNIQEYFHNDGEPGVFHFGTPEFDKNDNLTPKYLTKVDPNYEVNDVPALISFRTTLYPYLEDAVYTEYRTAKREAYHQIRREQNNGLHARREKREAENLSSHTEKRKAEFEQSLLEQRIEDERLKRKGKIRKGRELQEAKLQGMKVKEIIETFGVSPNKIPEYIEFYNLHKDEIE